MSYTPTTWVDGETPVNAENLNKMEEGIRKNSEDKLDADQLPGAVDAALAQAEASGKFKGDPGDSGVHVGADKPPETAKVWIKPDGIPTGTETWTFTLEDGTTVKKTVVVVG